MRARQASTLSSEFCTIQVLKGHTEKPVHLTESRGVHNSEVIMYGC